MNSKWEKCKQEVKGFPANYSDIIRSAVNTKSDKIKILRKTAGDIVYVDIPNSLGYEIELCVHNHKQKGVVKAEYYAWDHKNSTVFIRDLLNPPELKDYSYDNI